MTSSDPWSPSQYDKFQREREQPFVDLLDLVQPVERMRVVDLGCGTGRLTARLHERLQARETVGIDRSPRMLAAAAALGPVVAADAAAPPDARPSAGVRFVQREIEAFPPAGERYDLIFSNAALHWIDHHESLFERLASALAPAGQLAIQVPAMHDAPSHAVAAALIQEEPFRSASGARERPWPVLTPEAYCRLLFRLGFPAPAVRLIVYPHVLEDPEAVVEWMKGTLLAEYSRHMPADVFERFTEEYRRRLLPTIDTARPFVFPFKRILMWGRRSA
jgi:trans-aconitate 2-methyltransferase